MKIKSANFLMSTLLKEYNTSKSNVKLAASGGDKASGKNYDNIVSGITDPYKDLDYETKYMKVYPNLANIVKRLKAESIKGDVLVNGPALKELQAMLQTYNPKEDKEDGSVILPFGDNVRLKENGNNLFIGMKDIKDYNSKDLQKNISTSL